MQPLSSRLTETSRADAIARLCDRDADLRAIVERFGSPPLWQREEGFPTLVRIVLEQQVSLASARAAFDRLVAAVAEQGRLTPERFLALDDARLLEIGFSRQKAGYCRRLAQAVQSGELDLPDLDRLPDEEVFERLVALPGIGPWTASIYMLAAMGRPDVWPATDMALAASAAQVRGLAQPPSTEAMNEMAEAWRPWRSVAARLLWHDYLGRRSGLSRRARVTR